MSPNHAKQQLCLYMNLPLVGKEYGIIKKESKAFDRRRPVKPPSKLQSKKRNVDEMTSLSDPVESSSKRTQCADPSMEVEKMEYVHLEEPEIPTTMSAPSSIDREEADAEDGAEEDIAVGVARMIEESTISLL